MPKILYKFPSRERPEKLLKCLDNIFSLTKHDDFLILITLDIDDYKTSNKDFVNKIKSYGEKVMPVHGTSKNKIDAVNRDIWMVDNWDILCVHSDDMVFIKDGFDLDIIEAFSGFSGLVHFPDQVAKEKLVTYPMMSKDYYDIFGYVYHYDFTSVYADNLQTDVAKFLNRYKFVDKEILRHEHAIWGYGEKDDLLLRTEDPINYQKDNETYQRLIRSNYGI